RHRDSGAARGNRRSGGRPARPAWRRWAGPPRTRPGTWPCRRCRHRRPAAKPKAASGASSATGSSGRSLCTDAAGRWPSPNCVRATPIWQTRRTRHNAGARSVYARIADIRRPSPGTRTATLSALRRGPALPRTIPARPAFAVSVAAVVLFQVAALVARSSLELLLLRRGYAAPHAADLSFLVVLPVLLLFMSPWARRCAAPLCGLLRLRDLTWRTVALGVALGLDLRLLRWAALGWSLPAAGGDGASIGPLVGFACPPAGELLLATLVTVGLVPVVEETIHRGVILHALLARGRTLAIAVSTLVFALLH